MLCIVVEFSAVLNLMVMFSTKAPPTLDDSIVLVGTRRIIHKESHTDGDAPLPGSARAQS